MSSQVLSISKGRPSPHSPEGSLFQRTSLIQDSILLHSDRISSFICAHCLLSCHWVLVTGESPPLSSLHSPFRHLGTLVTPHWTLFSPGWAVPSLLAFLVPNSRRVPRQWYQQGPITGLLPSAPSQFPPVSDLPSACPFYAAESLPPPQPLVGEGKACSRLLLCAGHLEVLIPCL